MAKHNETGSQGEQLALAFLTQHGMAILATNYRFKRAEIDIIAFNGKQVLFVEVKTRSDIGFSHPETAVTAAKQKLYYQAAMHFLNDHPQYSLPRFDIISINLLPFAKHIYYFPDAFYPMQFDVE